MSTLIFDQVRAVEVLSMLSSAYLEQRMLYERVNSSLLSAPQQAHIPKDIIKGSRAHQIFLFFTTVITYASESDMGFRQSVDLYNRFPEYFGEELLHLDVSDVSTALLSVGFVRPNQGAGYWHGSGTSLYREFGGEPREFFSVSGVDEFLQRKKQMSKKFGREALPGIGPKIFSLMSLFFEELGIIPEMPGAFPVDLHVQRIMISCGIVQGSGRVPASEVAEFIRPRLYAHCVTHGIRPLDLSHALWFLGNRVCTVCRHVEGLPMVCPVEQLCGGAIPSMIYGRKGLWDLDAVRHRKGSLQSSLFDFDSEVVLDKAHHGRRRAVRMY